MSIFDVKIPAVELVKVTELVPVGDQILIAPMAMPDVQQTKGGLYIATEGDKFDPNNMDLRFGLVIGVGADCQFFEKGNVVYYAKYAGKDGDIGDGRIMQMREHEIMGVCDAEYKEK